MTKVQRAMDECERFLAAAVKVRAKVAETPKWPDRPFSGSPETAALRRASMDLSRALADLRQ